MKLYTRTGDKGQTSLIGGRVRKDDARVEAYGTIDELNSFVGVAAAEAAKHEGLAELVDRLIVIQHELFDCGSDLAYAKEGAPLKLDAEPASRLEEWIDEYTEEAPELLKFILPGGTALSSALHACRTVCRRAERRVVSLALAASHPVSEDVQAYLNRLSDFFFAAARVANARLGVADTEYERSAEVFRTGKSKGSGKQ
ncbi:cob(I)yrinic acid a,c-diamide adenosyltransferase [Paenibacillus harenae]|uniref:Corrinoid adenosyltransferase n=1 Tax=Paenibacillus harenae TaxID=306543 RepID=A0ABT9TUD4_PAEHA|nr:cob(I)yrinic acid a,c-diamide adenosyltransferase [Paenibacillus harenae]MDQ0061159.1 cob(I)alamin adenosyltransferase [Paenibacillus harenae]MDQ0110968.1 cob(I)alamin adenosyltransferase [Paenibacillus harenae]